MGRAKEQAEYQEAVGILCRVGALKECENHPGTYFDGPDDVEDAYRFANSAITAGTIILSSGQTRRQIMDRIKEAYDDNSGVGECQQCARNFNPD